MSIISVIGVMLGVLVGIVLLCLGVTRMEKTAKSSEYDERQQSVRGRGYRLAYWVGFVYLLVSIPMLVGYTEGEKKVEPYLLVLCGVMLQNLVFHAYCLLNHAALPMSQKPLFTALGFLLCGILWLCSSYNAQQHNPLALVGHGSDGWTYLMVAFTFLSMALMHLIQLLRREKE
jgi:uncharacterized membrane protein